MKNIILALAALISFSSVSRADIVFLNKGEELTGRITRIDDEEITLDKNGSKQYISRADVMKIQFIKEYQGGESKPKNDKDIAALMAKPPTQQEYPNDAYINWLEENNAVLNQDGTYELTFRNILYVLRDSGLNPAGNHKFSFTVAGNQRGELLYARSITGDSISYLTDVEVVRGAEYPEAQAYDKVNSIKFSIPGIKPGSIVEFAYKITGRNNDVFPMFLAEYFRSTEPVRLKKLTVTVPKKAAFAFAERNMPKDREFSQSSKGRNTVYSWMTKNLPSYKDEPNTPQPEWYTPMVLASAGTDWANLKRIINKEAAAKSTINDEMKKLVKDLTSKAYSQEGKAEALFNWVNKEIKTNPVPAEETGVLPEAADNTYTHRSGNYIDKPFLLYVLLKEAGLKPELALVSRRDTNYFEDGVPAPQQFFAAEAIVTMNGKTLVLCPINDNFRYNQLHPVLAGARALSITGTETLFTNPVSQVEEEKVSAIKTLIINPDGSMNGRMEINPTGWQQSLWRAAKNTSKETLDKVYEEQVNRMYTGGKLVSYRLENLNDMTQDMTIKIDFVVPDFSIKAGKYLLFRPDISYLNPAVASATRELPIYRPKYLEDTLVNIVIPEGYHVYYVPEGFEMKYPDYTHSAVITQAPRNIRIRNIETGNTDFIGPEGYQVYKSFQQNIVKFSREWFVLEKQ